MAVRFSVVALSGIWMPAMANGVMLERLFRKRIRA
jgi:hypothetical protein